MLIYSPFSFHHLKPDRNQMHSFAFKGTHTKTELCLCVCVLEIDL